MTRRLTLALVLGACAGLDVDPSADCVDACALAYSCGFLPSTLGYGASSEAARDDCLRLCNGSPADDPDVATILDCLVDPDEMDAVDGWCPDDTGTAAHTAGLQCEAASRCLAKNFPDALVLGGADLEVALVTFTEFVEAYGVDALAALYGPENVGQVRTCNRGLCGAGSCMQAVAAGDESPCDDTLCSSGMFQTGQTCGDLGAHTVDIVVTQPGTPMASQVLLDATEASTCKTTAVVFASAIYHLHPGPLRPSARVAGVLAAGDLADLGYPLPDDVTATTPVEYCLRFPGLAIQARSGDSLAVVPIGDPREIILHLPDPALRPMPCAG